jgi:ribulose-phosphate 3-epimerase
MNLFQTRERRPLLAPSLLAADPLGMRVHIDALNGTHQWLHLDIMDGHFVPNLSFGPMFLSALRRSYPEVPMDVHLMVASPESFLAPFATQGADVLTVHVEATPHIHRLLQSVRELGVHPGITLNPGTPVEFLYPVLHLVDLVLVMSVNPGFGGQSFLPEVVPKIEALHRFREVQGLSFLIEVDGGVSAENAECLVKSGCDVLVAGNSVFGTPQPELAANALLEAGRRGLNRG